jgi:NitT/TauT family transport system substrate-binding protein
MPFHLLHLPRRIAAATAATAATALTASAAACGTAPPATSPAGGPEKPDLVVAAVRATDEVPLYIAQQRGFFTAQGLHVTIAPVSTSVAAIPGLLRGSIDVIAGANYVSFFGAQAEGVLRIKVIAPAASCTSTDFAVVTLPHSAISTPAGLAGKTISVPSTASVNTLLIDAQLAAHGVSPSTARFVSVPFASALAALKAHRVDAISLIEPFLTEASAAGAQTVMQLCMGPTAGLPLSGDISTAAWAAKYPRTAAAFARAITRGAQVAALSRAAGEQVLAANVRISPPSLIAMVNFNAYPFTLGAAQIQQVANLMLEDGLLHRRLNVTPLLLGGTR